MQIFFAAINNYCEKNILPILLITQAKRFFR